MCECGVDISSDFPSASCRRNAQGDSIVPTEFTNVCARNTKQEPLRAQRLLLCNKLELEVEETSAVCTVWVFSPPARMSAYSGSSEALQLC